VGDLREMEEDVKPVPASPASSAGAHRWQPLRAAAANLRGDSGSAAMARGAVGVFVVNVAGTALNVALQVWLARLLGVAEFGIYVYVLAWLNVLLVMGVMGLDSAALRFLSAYRGTGELGRFWGFLHFARGRVWLLSAAVSLLLAGGAWLLRDRLGAHKALVFWLGCVLLPLNVLITFDGSVLQALKRVIQSKSLQFVVRLVTMFSMLAALHFLLGREIDAVAAMIVNGASALLVLAALRWLVKRELPPRVAPESVRTLRTEWNSASRSLFAITGCQLLLSQVDVLLVGMFLDTTQVGLYAAASRIAVFVTFGINSVNNVLAPTIAELFARNQRRELQATAVLAARIVMAYTIPVVAFLLIAGKWVLSWFGPQFVAAYPVLAVLAGGQMVPALSGSVGFLMTMTGHQREALAVIFGSAALTLVLNLALIPWAGPIGAAVGTMTATAARSIALSVLVRRRLQLRPTAVGL
jgi:O-antigen/teichoic acid export membrane protein